MKPSENKAAKLFESLRQSPTELPLEKIELMIQGLPDLAAKPTIENNWSNLLNLKNLIMISIPIAMAISLFVYSGQQETTTPITSTETNVEQVIEMPIQKEAFVIDEESAVETILGEQSKIDIENIATDEVLKQRPSKPQTQRAQQNLPTNKELTKETEPKTDKEVVLAKKEIRGTSVAQANINTEPTTLPNMTDGEVRRLKRTLYKNLLADNLIRSKNESVTIDLPGADIFINGEKIAANLLLKYMEITHKVGQGPERKVEMNRQYIKVGDFTADGFKGIGIGTFYEESTKEKRETREKTAAEIRDEKIEGEEKALSLFAKSILAQLPTKKGKKSLFNVNLKYKKGVKLHRTLYELLVVDQLINSPQDFVLIELPKKEIRINGLTLSDQQYSKYTKLFTEYKIKSGAIREIRMSESTFSVGDYSPGEFTGTSIEIRK